MTDLEFVQVLQSVLPGCDNKMRLYLIYSAFRDAANLQQKLGFQVGSEVMISEGRACAAEAMCKILKERSDKS